MKKRLKRCKCDPYKNECCNVCTGWDKAIKNGKLKDKLNKNK